MTFTIVTHHLTRHNETTYKQIFKRCFAEKWKASIPFPKDPIVAAQDSRGQVVGFCFVHAETPYPMTHGPGAFMYNLCVDPEHRKKGAGTAILQRVKRDYKQVYAHMLASEQFHSLMTRQDWKRIGVWREKYIEYACGFEVTAEAEMPTVLNTEFYDPDENVTYIS